MEMLKSKKFKKQCPHILICGPRKGKQCTNMTSNTYCSDHNEKRKQYKRNKCKYKLPFSSKDPKKKGRLCKNYCSGDIYCCKHLNKKNPTICKIKNNCLLIFD
jgi:hypothetical protein